MAYKFQPSVKFGSQKYTIPLIILIILIVLRLSIYITTTNVIFSLIAFAALLGILLERKWGLLAAMGLAGIELLLSVLSIGAEEPLFILLPMFIDVVMIYIAYTEYKKK